MRRLLATLTAIVVLAASASAAEPRPGIEAGGSIGWLGYDLDETDARDPRTRLDFNAAATVHFDFGRIGGLTTGLRYSRLGDEVRYGRIRTAEDPTGESTSGTLTNRQAYLGVPLLARWNFLGKRGAYLFGGAEVAWLSWARSELVYDPSVTAPVNPEGERDVTDSLKRYNLTAVIGAGIELDIGRRAVEIAIRYGHGLVNVVDDPLDGAALQRSTREAALTIGWRM